MMNFINIFLCNIKWRFQNPQIIVMTLLQPLLWLLLFTTMFGENTIGLQEYSNYTSFALPGIIVMVILTSAGMSGIANYSWIHNGIFHRIFISPIKRSAILLGHIMDAVALTFFEVIVLFLVSIFLDVNVQTGFIGFILIFLLVFLTTFFVSSLSYLISITFKDENSFIALVNMLILPLFFASTGLMPYDKIPKILQYIVKINPFTYVIDSIRLLVNSHNLKLETVFLTSIFLVILSTLSFVLTIYRLNRISP